MTAIEDRPRPRYGMADPPEVHLAAIRELVEQLVTIEVTIAATVARIDDRAARLEARATTVAETAGAVAQRAVAAIERLEPVLDGLARSKLVRRLLNDR